MIICTRLCFECLTEINTVALLSRSDAFTSHQTVVQYVTRPSIDLTREQAKQGFVLPNESKEEQKNNTGWKVRHRPSASENEKWKKRAQKRRKIPHEQSATETGEVN